MIRLTKKLIPNLIPCIATNLILVLNLCLAKDLILILRLAKNLILILCLTTNLIITNLILAKDLII